MVTIKKKLMLIWLFIALIAAFIILYSLGNNKEKEINEIAETYYNIYDVEYPSYSLLKYIALNELSYEEVANELSKCGMTIKSVFGSSETIYSGNCGEIALTILNRSNNKEYIQYLYTLQTNSKEYLRFLKADISSEKDFKGNDNLITGKINDSWRVYLVLEEPSPYIMFQRPQSK